MAFHIHTFGDFPPQRVRAHWSETPARRTSPEVDAIIESAWTRAAARPGVRLFDGPMCRLDRFELSPSTPEPTIDLFISPTGYKAFVGTNLTVAAGAPGSDTLRPLPSDFFANPIGLSPALRTADHRLVFGRRSPNLAYHPSRIHPFSGALDPADLREPAGIIAGVTRELAEELRLAADEITDLRLIALIGETAMRQPELIFWATTTATAENLRMRMDDTEHTQFLAIAADGASITRALFSGGADIFGTPFTPADFTPVGTATLLLAGRRLFGDGWFARVAPSVDMTMS